MSLGYHPSWCALDACTAYVEHSDELHRSEPVVVETDDPTVELFVFKTANPDGRSVCIELVKLTVPTALSWHLSEPLLGTELVLPMTSAEAVSRAVAVLA